MELKIYFRMIKKNWWVILLVTFIAVNATMVLSLVATKKYQLTAKYVVTPSLDLFDSDQYIDSMTALESRTIVSTYTELLNTDNLYEETLKELGYPDPEAPEVESIQRTAVNLTETNFIVITVEGPDPVLITDIANLLGEKGTVLIAQLFGNVYSLTAMDKAVTPKDPISPQPVRDTILAFALGPIVGICLAILFETIRTPLDEYREKSKLDRMANCYNAKHFSYLMEQEILNIEDQPISIGLVQFTGLTTLIDNLPQSITQSILTRITHLLRRELRGNDIIGRLDSNLYGIIMIVTPEIAAEKAIERITNALSIELKFEDEKIPLSPVTSSVAVLEGETAQQAFDRAYSNLGASYTRT